VRTIRSTRGRARPRRAKWIRLRSRAVTRRFAECRYFFSMSFWKRGLLCRESKKGLMASQRAEIRAGFVPQVAEKSVALAEDEV
jgi:hypothetical protein